MRPFFSLKLLGFFRIKLTVSVERSTTVQKVRHRRKMSPTVANLEGLRAAPQRRLVISERRRRRTFSPVSGTSHHARHQSIIGIDKRIHVTETELISRIARIVPSRVGDKKGAVRLGIGDDAAILSGGQRLEWAVSCDAFVEGVHFLVRVHPPDSVGYKALARATSDLVAMGAKPRFFLLTLVLPTSRTGRWLDAFLRGMARAARRLDMRLIGGDTTTGRSVSASLTVFGQVEAGRAVTRSGAPPGDLIYVSGKLGRAQLGLELALACGGNRSTSGAKARDESVGRMSELNFRPPSNASLYHKLLRPHLYPRIRVELGRWLARNRIASAMMDLSDGLSRDLARLCDASGVGARLSADRIPAVALPRSIARLLPQRTRDALQMALHGGDDYELLFAVSQRNEKKLRKAPGFAELTCIGEFTANRGVVIVDPHGRAKPLKVGGWDSFR
jgi:thiamine-monophosphate kinase